ncbi:MAG: hypothetical protein GY863_24075 [bacterium]|nr:hypothetical protein [bacterium]
MLRSEVSLISIIAVIFIFGGFSQQETFPELSGSYLGQEAPSDKAGVFMDGIISILDEPEMCAAFTEDGKEFYFNRQFNNYWSIFVTREKNGQWTRPEPLSFSGGYTDRDFTMSPDGSTIVFGSDRPTAKGGRRRNRLDIFYTKRLPECKWSEPMNIGAPINTDFSENYPSLSENGNLYFFSQRTGGHGGCDIYLSRFVDGQYTVPETLDSSVNSEKNDWDSFISPDESYIIFSSQNRDDTIGGQDLYISFRDNDGSWTKAVNMGPAVNSVSGEICPSVSPDGRYLFFTSRRRGKADIFWIKAGIIEEIKRKIIKSEN